MCLLAHSLRPSIHAFFSLQASNRIGQMPLRWSRLEVMITVFQSGGIHARLRWWSSKSYLSGRSLIYAGEPRSRGPASCGTLIDRAPHRADDGLSIYGCSSDGTICAIQFDPTELPDLADVDATTKIIEAQRQKLARPMTRRPLPPPLTPSSSLSLAPSQQLTNGFGAMPSEQVINQLTAKQKVTILPGGKRRIQPSLLASLSSTQIMNPGSMATSSASEGQARAGAFGLGNDQGAFESGLRRNDPPAPVGAIEGRTLGGDRPTEQAPPREIRPAFVAPPTSSTGAAGSSSIMLPIPVIQEKLVSKCEEDPNIWVEATNSENGEHLDAKHAQRGIF